ncbi:MAG: VCBS repeat-containing protein [Verrucomicrobiales bacterium]|nr:VCBS repeat-containing protein [Verrucomicrobiales bacterium]
MSSHKLYYLALSLLTLLVSCSDNSESTHKKESILNIKSESKHNLTQEGFSELAYNKDLAWSSFDNPSKDGWNSEYFANKAQDQLSVISKIIKDSDPTKSIEPSTDKVSFTTIRPDSLDLVYSDKTFEVHRQNAEPLTINTGKELFLKNLRNSKISASEEIQVKFKITDIKLNENAFKTTQLFSLSFRTKELITDERSVWDITWEENQKKELKISSLTVRDYEKTIRKSSEKLFSDCTESIFSGNSSYKEQLTKGVNEWLEQLPAYAMLNRFGTPGMAIGDINGDGLEDLYLCQEPGIPNKLFLQNKNGTLKDISKEWKVDWIEDSRSALLVDLDNDGDPDLVVAMYGNIVIAANEGSKKGFEVVDVIPTSESTSSLSAADYDLDGKLDIYVCCYAPNKSSDATAMQTIGANARRFVYHDDNNGPENFLLKNETDSAAAISFRDVTKETGLNSNNQRWSFAASWEDFDIDGDPDLYVANDYGRNNLYRNDEGTFKDVAAQMGVEDSASGMSVTWADYDLDGRQDLYVSNMFSAAGSRITTQKEFKPDANLGTRKRFRRFTRGNTLFRNTPEGFIDTSESAGVTMGRWAWGSRFVDLNNDGWQDLVVANGYLSAADNGTGDL